MLGKKKTSRGASVKNTAQRSRQIDFSIVYSLLGVGALILVGVVVYSAINVLLTKPVTRVAVTGTFRYVDRQAIAEQVQPFLTQGFVRLDLQAIRKELTTRAWIYDVTIARVWPDEITIHVVEQKPIARWADVGYLNHRGNLFNPKKMVVRDELPVLEGPEGSTEQVMINFQRLGESLQQQGLTLQALSLDQRGNWVATLDSQISIVLGSTQIMEKMRRFVKAYQAVLSGKFKRVQRIDMRYSNGLAIAWREDPKPAVQQDKG